MTTIQPELAIALARFGDGRIAEADTLASQILVDNPNSSEALLLRGVIAGLQNRHAQAESFLLLASSLDKRNFFVCFNLAKALSEQGKHGEAVQWHLRALEIDSAHDRAWLNYGSSLFHSGELTAAISAFDHALAINESLAEGYSNKGNCFLELGKSVEALSLYDRAIELDPLLPEAWLNRGSVLFDLGRFKEALSSYDRSIEHRPDYAEAWGNRGLVLRELHRPEDAIASFRRALALDPYIEDVLGDLLDTQLMICDWHELDMRLEDLRAKIVFGERAATPFSVLSLFDDPLLQRRCADVYSNGFSNSTCPSEPFPINTDIDKIVVAYVSMDFCNHPVSHLIAELIELHDRESFQIFGFSLGVTTSDLARRRLERAFDRFWDIRELSESDIANLARSLGVDIAIDLGGYTKGSRPAMFSRRLAPIQIAYLGFPGTMGGGHHDYFIGDRVAITEVNLSFFSEKVIFMPHSFQANPRSRFVGRIDSSREDYGLPRDGFVFCCMNNTWKVRPEVLARWARIMLKVPGSVFLLLADSMLARRNLALAFAELGVSGSRLVFARRLSYEAYLDQFRHADLFLDTLPYSAGTTASDALWMGLPVLTLAGESFSGRMAASLLHAVGLPELVVGSTKDYENLAIELAQSPNKVISLKNKLAKNRDICPLFNAPLFARHIETAFREVNRLRIEGLAPEHIFVRP